MGDDRKETGRKATDLIGQTADVVSAYLSNNPLSAAELPSILAAVHASLSGLDQAKTAAGGRRVPHMPIKKTITPDAIISLEDGKPYKTLGRHLSSRGLTPQQYREKWGLPTDYPMMAPNYAKVRSDLAKATGLGRHRHRAAKAVALAKAPASQTSSRKATDRQAG